MPVTRRSVVGISSAVASLLAAWACSAGSDGGVAGAGGFAGTAGATAGAAGSSGTAGTAGTGGTGLVGGFGGSLSVGADSDGDGFSDAEEGKDDPAGPRDTDGDGTPDYLDTDSDGDGLLDGEEKIGEPDFDLDGKPNHLDTDSDDDGLPDSLEGLTDTDGDLWPDFLDIDSDQDGLEDGLELDGDPDGDGIPNFRDLDSDADCIEDLIDGAEDWDGDGTPNFVDAINDGTPTPLALTAISTTFNKPIGIDYHEPTNTVVMSVNYDNGAPLNFERVQLDGTHQPFSSILGLTNEVKIATARSGNLGGFLAGDFFVGNGVDGQIVRITDDGATLFNPWVDLPGAANGLMRGSLYVDRTDVFGGDLVAVTTAGQVWRVTSAGVATQIAAVGVHLEGLIVVPNCPARYGPIAGKAIAGAEEQGLLHAFGPDGSTATYSLGVAVEDIDLVTPHENFFGVNYGTSQLLGAASTVFQAMAGDILLAQESVAGGSTGLFRLKWGGSMLIAEPVPLGGGASVGQWEHVTFAGAGIVEVPVPPKPPGTPPPPPPPPK